VFGPKRERRAPAGGDVRLQVRLREPELVREAIFGDDDLVEVRVVRQLIVVARADVADLDRHVLRQAPLHAERPGARVRDLDVRIEDVDAVADVRRQRIARRLLAAERRRTGRTERQRREPRRVPHQHRPRLPRRDEQPGRRVAVLRDRDAGIAVEDAGERADRVAVVGNRVAAADGRLLGIAEQPAEPS